MAYEKILYDVDANGIARITLNDAQRMNPLGWKMLKELDTALKAAEDDDNVRVIVIKGAGRCFSTGYDLASGLENQQDMPRWRKQWPHSIWNSRAHVQGHIEYWFNIWNLWKPVIAQVHGFCLAGATELASICDLMVVSEDLRFGYPPTRWMATGDMIGIYSWHAGLKVAKEMSFGRILSGKECLEYGFANHCVPADKLEEETAKVANRIAHIHPELLANSKRVVNRTFEIQGFRVSLESSGEFDTHSHMGQDYGYRKLSKELGVPAALKKLNEPWGGV
ncbi:MAG: enoyl-CoA hydratase/isomerase family protein [Chloroflexi bacterium]|nr:enoyl-CoA hydratase/isomerase family protein [Chloroflexota bacterium]